MQSVPRVANPRRKSATLLQVCILLSAGSAAQGATYTAANTVNLNTGSVEMFAFGVGGGQQVGAGYVGSNSEQAFLWTNSSSSAVNLTPNGYITSIASAVGPGEQVGSVSTDSMGASPLAALWRNSAQTFVNLTPAQLGATSSIALATDGAQEGGFFDSAAGRHAVIWAGTAASAVDLHPTVAGSTFSVVNAVNGGLQGGEVSVNGFFHAFLWSGTAASARDLHPTNLPSATSSQINGVYGNEQVGYAKFNSVDTAIVWHGSADSAVSLQPAGYGFSQALATNGSQQVGYANVVSTTFTHAMIWSGTAASAVDLHSLIPGAVSSRATAIDVYGNVAGYARLGDQLDHPVTWLAGDTFVANAGTGAWNTAARWSGGIPAAGADVLILQNDGVPRYISYVSPTPSSIGNLTIDAGGFGSVGVIQGQDSLTAVNEFVGFVGTGYYNQSGGTHTVTNTLTLATRAGSQGTYFLSGGTLTAAHLSVNDGGVFVKTAGALVTPDFKQNGGLVSFTTLTLAGGVSSYALSGGTLTAAAIMDNVGGSFTQTGAGRIITNTFTQQDGNFEAENITVGTGDISTFNQLNGDTFITNLTLQAGGNFNSVGVFVSGQFKQSGGVLTGTAFLYSTATYNFTGGSVNGQVSSAGTANIAGIFSASNGFVNSGTVNLPGNAFATFNGAGFVNNGVVSVQGGFVSGTTLTNNALFTGFGQISIVVVNNGQFTQSGGNISAGIFTNNGALALANGLVFTVGGAFTNHGAIELNGASVSATLTNAADGTVAGPGIITSLSNAGLLHVPNGLTKTGSFTNTGIVELAGAAANLAAGGTLTNAATIEGNGKISQVVVNNGAIEATGGTLIFAGALTNGGTMRTNTLTKLLMQGNIFPANAGLISLAGGTFDAGGNLLANLSTGQMTGYGILSTGGLTNNGAITLTGGTSTINGPLTNNAGKTINIKYQPAIFTGPVTNNGTIKTTSTTVTFTGPYTGNAYISDPSVNIFQNNVTIIPGGLMTGGPGDEFHFTAGTVTNNGTFTNAGLLDASAPLQNNGTFSQTGALTLNASFTNAGIATLSGTLNFSPAITLSNTAGTATVSPANISAAMFPHHLSITGGSIIFSPTDAPRQTSAVLITAGTLNISNTNSVLDLTNHDLMITNNNASSSNTLINTLWKNGVASLVGNGDPNGPQITSSTATHNTSNFPTFIVAFDIDAVFGGGVTGDGSGAGSSLGAYTDNQIPLPGTIMVKYGYYTDIDFSGKVDAGDINLILGALGQATPGLADPGLSYLLGDVDYSGKVDAGDINLVLGMLGAGSGGAHGSPLAAPSAAPVSVPESWSGMIFLLGTLCLGSRKRARQKVV